MMTEIKMHAGFSWVGTGAITTKENVERFIYSQSSLIARENLTLADMYFATWFNQVTFAVPSSSSSSSSFGNLLLIGTISTRK